MENLTIIILTKNEEFNIKAAVKNARQCANTILVVDSGSTDNTVKIAEESGATVEYRAWTNDFASQRNFALSKAQTDWVLYLDADERLDDELIKDIQTIVAKNKQDAQYYIMRKSNAFGSEFNHGVLRPDKVIRLFPREKVKWVNKVHERPECDLPKQALKGRMKHYTYRSWSQYLNKFEIYTTIWAEDAYKKGKRTSKSSIIGHAMFSFIQMAFLRLGLLDGFMGVVLCCYHFFYTMMKYLKLYELQRRENK